MTYDDWLKNFEAVYICHLTPGDDFLDGQGYNGQVLRDCDKLGYNELHHIVDAMVFTTAVAVVETGQLECCRIHWPVDQGSERWRLRQFAQ